MEDLKRRMRFFKTALSDYGTVGAFTMSSDFVVRRVLAALPASPAVAVEFGAGDGVLTRALLDRLDPAGELTAVEPHRAFVEALGAIGDRRLRVISSTAHDALSRLEPYRGRADAVVASVPFWFLARAERAELVSESVRLLKPGGVFAVFNQYTPLAYVLVRKTFGNATLAFEVRNFPPCFMVFARKGPAKPPAL